ncbi:LysR family transcriptional regulator [Novosphingobium profundi]|uniref:LysR family transcriptional regulator n=1 Tax=Novosphingobium profundi TaxID=1774954 RepID=UPI001BDB55E2|nr:LysR family transcriptional regulator [Novosphingobium profundi]MBT0667437.1 LysR family transcriptional regulator [Novosphingobium profundi]
MGQMPKRLSVKWKQWMLDDINEIRTFVRIAGEGSLSRAAQTMGLSLSVVSKRLATLEARTRTLLIARSTRRLALTPDGQRFLERAKRILAEVSEAEAMLAQGELEPQGLLRINAPVALGRAHVAPVCQELVERHGNLEMELSLTDRLSGLIDEGLDVIIRIGQPQAPGLVMRKLADNHRVIVASPRFIERKGAPSSPEGLLDYDCLHDGDGSLWQLVRPDGSQASVTVTSRLRCNNGEVWGDWATGGFGLALKSLIDVAEDLRTGRLIRVLPQWSSPPAPVCALLPARTLIPSRVRVFLEAMALRLRRANERSSSAKADGIGEGG